jgi:hypothetical protein
MKANLADRPALFDACYQKFFFVEKYPENAKRFNLWCLSHADGCVTA